MQSVARSADDDDDDGGRHSVQRHQDVQFIGFGLGLHLKGNSKVWEL